MMVSKTKIDRKFAILVTPKDSDAVFAISKKIINIVDRLSDSVLFVCGNIPDTINWPNNVRKIDLKVAMHYAKSINPRWYSVLLWIVKMIYVQLRMGLEIFLSRDQIDIVICFLGNYYQIPIIVSRILGKKVICTATGIESDIAKNIYGKFIPMMLSRLAQFNYQLAHRIMIESWKLGEYDLFARWKNKLVFGALYYGDSERFKYAIPLDERKDIIGYVGRFSIEKGIIEFIEAVPGIIEQHPDWEVFLIGGGMLGDEVSNLIRSLKLTNQVKIYNWIENEALPNYYNQMKLVVMPSKTEGLPNVLLEAISCGTPVLATQVGGIPDIIVDETTGFVLKNISPDEIGKRVTYALSDISRLKTISQNAMSLVHQRYSLDAAVERYFSIFSDLIN